MTPAEQIAALEAEAAAAEAEAAAFALTAEEQALAAALERAKAAREQKATAAATRRANDGAARLRAARARLPAGTLLEVIDLVAYFPLGQPPPAEVLPNSGVIVVRDPDPTLEKELLVEFEHKTGAGAKLVDDILVKILLKSTVDPDASASDAGGAEGVKLQAYCQRYPAAARQAAGVARRLGGAKATEAKRGRE